MILYLDTSALVKRYFCEPFSEDVIDQWKAAAHIVTSFVAYAETMACIHRKKRDARIGPAAMGKIAARFRRDWESLVRVTVGEELQPFIDRVVEAYPLRGFDAIHLASALAIHERIADEFLFACFDERLTRAAAAEGLETFPAIA